MNRTKLLLLACYAVCINIVLGIEAFDNKFVLYDEPTMQINQQKILVIGPTGAGKTSFINNLAHTKLNDMDLHEMLQTGISTTTRTQTISSDLLIRNNAQLHFHFVDTIGFGADDINVTQIFDSIKNEIMFDREIHKVIILYKLERFRPDIHADLNVMLKDLYNYGAQPNHIYLGLTHHELWIDAVVDAYTTQLLTNLELELDSSHIFFPTFPNLLLIRPELHPFFLERMRRSRETVIQLLCSPSRPFSPIKTIFQQTYKKDPAQAWPFLQNILW